MPKPPGADSQRLIALKPGKSTYLGRPTSALKSVYSCARRHVPGAMFRAEEREGGCVVTRIDQGAAE